MVTTTGTSDPIKVISSQRDLDNILSNAGPDQLTVIDFHAVWCGPCKMIAPRFKDLAERLHTKANFVKCDVDEAKDVASAYGVRAMPTFVFIKGKNEISEDRIQGADWKRLEALVTKYTSGAQAAATGAFTGKGHTLNETTAVPDATPSALNLTPQAKVIIGLVTVYALLWYFS